MTNDEKIPVDDFLEVVEGAPASVVPDIVEIVSGYGGEAAATMFLEMIFFADPGFEAVWKENYAYKVKDEHAVMYALLRAFIPDPNDCRDEDFFEPHRGFERWQQVARQLLRFDARYAIDGPWLYGWAMWGRSLLDQWDAGFIYIHETPGADAFAERVEEATGKKWLHELPESLAGIREVEGIDDQLIRQMARSVIEELLRWDVSGAR